MVFVDFSSFHQINLYVQQRSQSGAPEREGLVSQKVHLLLISAVCWSSGIDNAKKFDVSKQWILEIYV